MTGESHLCPPVSAFGTALREDERKNRWKLGDKTTSSMRKMEKKVRKLQKKERTRK
jgi:hypothetical protein